MRAQIDAFRQRIGKSNRAMMAPAAGCGFRAWRAHWWAGTNWLAQGDDLENFLSPIGQLYSIIIDSFMAARAMKRPSTSPSKRSWNR